jgi:hypothetical protein
MWNQRCAGLLTVALAAAVLAGSVPRSAAEAPGAVLDRIGVQRGLCVVLGDPQGEMAVGLAKGSELMVYL